MTKWLCTTISAYKIKHNESLWFLCCILSLLPNGYLHFIICIYAIVSCVDFTWCFPSEIARLHSLNHPNWSFDRKVSSLSSGFEQKFHLECIEHLCDKHSNDVYDFFSLLLWFKVDKTNVDCKIILRHNFKIYKVKL